MIGTLPAAFRNPAMAQGRSVRSRGGFTLVEMLVAMALSLIIVLAVAQVFRLIGDNVLASRATLEMSGQLRGAAGQLQSDLGGVTAPVRPWLKPSGGQGYFEVLEGALWDMGLGTTPYPQSIMGDVDDVLMFTSRAKIGTFVGQIEGHIDTTNFFPPRLVYVPGEYNSIESSLAEVAWFTRFNDYNGNGTPDSGEVTLHRRTFLILPELDLSDPTVLQLPPGQFYAAFDISAAIREVLPATAPRTWAKQANTLETLGQRENRTAHNVSGGYPLDLTDVTINRPFPYQISRALLVPQGTVVTRGTDGQPGRSGVDDDGNGVVDDVGEMGAFGTDDRTVSIDSLIPPLAVGYRAFAESFGNDVMLSDLLAFDVRVFDQMVPIRTNATAEDPLVPGDPGYATAPVAVIGQGAYVDLFFNRYTVPNVATVFSGLPANKSGLGTAVYDTWTWYYEQDGVDQFGDGAIDWATDGLDNDNLRGADDVGERETSPPYPVPLRGIQIRLRIIDRDSRQVRQLTVASDFVPE